MDKIFTYPQAKKVFASPALIRRANGYPLDWRGQVPLSVKLSKNVKSDLPIIVESPTLVAFASDEYPVWVNSYGAVAIVYPDGRTLGVTPNEFTVIQFHPQNEE